MAFIIVRTLKVNDEKHIGQKLSAIPGIQEVHLIAGEDAFLIKVRVVDNEELGQFIRDKIWSIKAVKATRTSIVLSTFKETGRIPIDDPSS